MDGNTVGEDGLKRAKWVDCSTNPKKHGEFEGHIKGEPTKVKRYMWTGRQWMFCKPAMGRKKAHWFPSIFGEPGDKWRGLAEDPNAPLSIAVPYPDTCPVTDIGTLFSEEEQKAMDKYQAEKACECTIATKLVGDGCETCNPEKAEELAQEVDSAT